MNTAHTLLSTRPRELSVEQANRLVRLLGHGPALICELNSSGTILFANETVQLVTGYQRDELLGRNWWHLCCPGSLAQPAHEFQQRLHQGDVQNYELTIQTKSGNNITLELSSANQHHSDGSLATYLLFGINISAYKQTELALRRSQELFCGIIGVSDDGIVVLDAHSRITLFNHGAERIFGYSVSEALGKPFTVLMPARMAETYQQELAQALASGESHGKTRCEWFGQRKQGDEFPLEATIAQFHVDTETITTLVLHDVTRHKQAEAALQQINAQLVASVAELEQLNSEMNLLSELSDILQVCSSVEEAYAVITRFARRLFPETSGALSILRAKHNLVETVTTWGDLHLSRTSFLVDDCWALRRGRVHVMSCTTPDPLCRHLHADTALCTMCVPMIAQGESLGILHLQAPAGGDAATAAQLGEPQRRLAVALADHVALGLANIKLRETLHNQAIRDPLTGLFNRRYMEESLERELHRASRSHYPIGVVMLDIDHFKQFNDTFGHDAGDTLLREVGAFLQASIRA
ncbi:MAG: PAS domain S-box protein, partial [Chloroflexaceae bacterium]|nr:PAS domain S-box protein [Chloroflexaceae bacterium]